MRLQRSHNMNLTLDEAVDLEGWILMHKLMVLCTHKAGSDVVLDSNLHCCKAYYIL